MSGTEVAIGAGLVKLAIEQGGRPGFAKLKALLVGKTVMVVGPTRSGKTTFMDYMCYEVFQQEQETSSTLHFKGSKDFRIKVGEHQALVVAVKTAVDSVGETHPRLIAEEVHRRRPHALIIMLDLSAPLDERYDIRSSASWLESFCTRAEQLGRKRRKTRLRSLIVAMNKADLVDDATVAAKEQRYRQIMRDHWKGDGDPLFRRCVCVLNKDHRMWINSILADVAKQTTEPVR
jgi:hypothetical protein